MRTALVLLLSLALAPLPSAAQVLTLNPDLDNTLFETATGSLSNGAGIGVFAGLNGGGVARRGLIRFPVASSVPVGSQVVSATLRLHASQGQFEPKPFTVHRVEQAWGEAGSNATFMGGGGGAPSQSGDATWLHTFFSASTWSSPGGDFDAQVLATAFAPSFGWVEFGPTTELTQLVRDWTTGFKADFGLLLKGEEVGIATAVRFDSREFSDPTRRPQLVLTLAPLADAGDGLRSRFGLRALGASPFRGQTRLELSLPRSSDVSIEVHDVLGARVRTLHAGALEAGAHALVWDGRDADGRSVAAGVYLVRATTREAAASTRLVRLQ